MNFATSIRSTGIALIMALALGLVATSAQASIVTVGSPLTASFIQGEINSPTTMVNSELPEPGIHLVSPVTGAVVGWRMIGTGGPWRLRVLTPKGGTTYAGEGTSGSQEPTGAQSFATNLPIKAGQTVGIENLGKAHIGLATVSEATYEFINPAVADGKESAGTEVPGKELAFNAEIQPAPTVTNIGLTSGPAAGGTAVKIAGSDFNGVTEVKFGAMPAGSFTVESEGSLTAISPPVASAETVDVSVTTVAGTSAPSPADRFQYQRQLTLTQARHCIVPKLKGKTLKAARRKLRTAGCTLGRVRGHQSRSARVKRQGAKPGKVLAAGSKVNVKVSQP